MRSKHELCMARQRMRRTLRFGLTLLTLAQLVGCAAAPPRAVPEAQPVHDTLRHVALGLCEDYPEETRTLDEVRRDFTLMKQTGVDVLRVSIGWDGLEPEKDHYDWGFWDAFVQAADERGIRLIPYVAYTPRWNSDGGASDYWKTPPRDLAEFGELMGLLATRYRGRIRSWELWNEPDNRDYWLGDVKQYAALLKTGSAAVHAAGPELEVVSGGLAGGLEFFRALFQQEGVRDAIDVVNLHAYYETWNASPLERMPTYIDDVAELSGQRAGRPAIWMAEVGYSNWRSPLPAGGAPQHEYEHSLEFQAAMVVRTLTLLLTKPAISLVAWYELKDPKPLAAMIGDDNNRHLGVAYADYRPKPALDALAFMSRMFSRGFREVDARLRVSERSGADLELHGFVTEHDSLVLIAWVRTRSWQSSGQPEVSSGEPPALRADERQEHVRVWAPYPAHGQTTVFDERGRRLEQRVEKFESSRGVTLGFDVAGGQARIIELAIRPR
jgi:hypothetical protein